MKNVQKQHLSLSTKPEQIFFTCHNSHYNRTVVWWEEVKYESHPLAEWGITYSQLVIIAMANSDRVIKPLTQSRGLLYHPEWIMIDWLFPTHYTATSWLNKYTDIKYCFETWFYYLRIVHWWQLVILICICNSLPIILCQSDIS